MSGLSTAESAGSALAVGPPESLKEGMEEGGLRVGNEDLLARELMADAVESVPIGMPDTARRWMPSGLIVRFRRGLAPQGDPSRAGE